MAELRKYGVAATILFPLIERGEVSFKAGISFAASGDVKISKNEGAFANTSANPVHEGNGIYSLALTATEMQAARIVVTVIDQSNPKIWEDQAVLIDSYGHASAQHAFDLGTATQNVNVASMDSGVITAAAIAANALSAAKFATDALETIADNVLKRAISNVEPGAAFRTLYGAIASLVNRARIINSKDVEVYKTDDSTVLATLTGTTDNAQEPIKELDP